jgi:hypothetical protein
MSLYNLQKVLLEIETEILGQNFTGYPSDFLSNFLPFEHLPKYARMPLGLPREASLKSYANR